MKKFIVLGLAMATLCFTSCQVEDDDATPPQENNDQLVGSWQFTKIVNDGVELEVEACHLLMTMTVSTDGSLVFEDYETDEDSGDCISFTEAFEWKNLGNNEYELTIINPEDVADEESVVVQIIFIGDTLKMINLFEDGEVIENHFRKI